MIISELYAEHIGEIHKVEASAFESPWSEKTIEALINNECAKCFGCFVEGVLVGYIALEWVLDEGSLTNLAVMPSYRRQGIAEALTLKLLDFAKEKALQFVTLEVRVTNTPASNLYRKTGFQDVGVRKNYYSNPREDALLMTKYL